MSSTNIFDALQVIACLIVFCIIVYKLTALVDKFTWVERIGMAGIAAGAMMVIAPVTYKPSPYDDWAFTMMLMSQAAYFVGRMTRHKLNNSRARKQAAKWRANR
jgi:hypothetical protein